MKFRQLADTGVFVSELCLGTMTFGGKGQIWENIGGLDQATADAIVHRALDQGINFIDTADVYSAGESEEIVGRAINGRRDDVVLATKFFAPMGSDPNRRGGSRRWILHEVEDSLRRLQTDHLDLYQIHRPDDAVDIDDTLGALSDLVHQGKIRYLGHSTFPADQIVEAQWVAERRGRERFVCEQPPYSMLVRAIETDVLPVCERYDMAVIPWSPLAGGWLSGKYRKGQELPRTHRSRRIPQRYDMALPGNQRKLEAADQLGQLADEVGISLIEMALAFVLQHPAVTSAIIGPRTMEQLEDQLAAPDVVLKEDVLDRIDEIVAPGTNLN